jgi:formylglycine-generating enzyme required for sulfatase activity
VDRAGGKSAEERALELREPGAGEDLELVEEGGRRCIWIRASSGKLEKWILPAAVVEIRPVPESKGKFQVSTAADPGVPMALVKGGSFPSGGSGEEVVQVHPFLMDAHEVSVERFGRFKETTLPGWRRRLPSEFGDPEQPAVTVSWEEASAFAAWAGREIPTARQWEFAAAWTGTRRLAFPWGDAFEAGGIEKAWQAAPSKITLPTKDISPWGVAGLAGGVREWCQDPMPGRPEHREIRGGSTVHPRGSWVDAGAIQAVDLLTARRGFAPRTSRMNDVGLRCIISLLPARAAAAGGGGKAQSR